METEPCAYAARGLLHIKRAFSETELTRVYECLDGEGWLRTTDQAMCFSPLPAWVVQLSTRLRDLASTTGYVADAERHLFDFKQCIVNQYAPGDGLTPHVDLDAFYAQVVELRQPVLRERPLGIRQKYIIVTANYPARARGVGKLMALEEARALQRSCCGGCCAS